MISLAGDENRCLGVASTPTSTWWLRECLEKFWYIRTLQISFLMHINYIQHFQKAENGPSPLNCTATDQVGSMHCLDSALTRPCTKACGCRTSRFSIKCLRLVQIKILLKSKIQTMPADQNP